LQYSEYKYLDWHKSVWDQLWTPGAGLPHALLLTGPEGIGKGVFGLALAARLLCEMPTGDVACGACSSCRWLASGNHPDFRHIIPEADAETDEAASETEKKKASRQIVIDQIRGLEDFVFIGAHRNGARVVLIEPAEAMNIPAANSLLKILEEPPSSVYFILISSQWRRLLPTIRSRCQAMKMPKPSLAEAHAWLAERGEAKAGELLALMGGAPLLALQESERGRGTALTSLLDSLAEPGREPLALAARWESQLQLKGEAGLPMETLIGVVQNWVFDLAQRKMANRGRFLDIRDESAKQLAKMASITGLIRCYNDLVKMRALANHPLNPRLYLEDMAERYLRALVAERT
jgi:DNA polymerase III subunit delta'